MVTLKSNITFSFQKWIVHAFTTLWVDFDTLCTKQKTLKILDYIFEIINLRSKGCKRNNITKKNVCC